MVTKIPEEVRAPQTEVVIPAAEEMDLKTKDMLRALESNIARMVEEHDRRMAAEFAGPVYATGFTYWNILTYGPYQTIGNPPYLPQKIVAAGQPFTMWSLIWVNQSAPSGTSLPASVVLGGRPYTVRFESIDLSTVSQGPNFTQANVFASPAQQFTWVQWNAIAPDPGPNPHLYEVNITMDVTLGGQPFAGFSTWHYDPDTEPAFLGMPQRGPEWQHERPARFLVYRL